MKVWPIDPLVPRNLRLEVPEKLPQGLIYGPRSRALARPSPAPPPRCRRRLVHPLYDRATYLDAGTSRRPVGQGYDTTPVVSGRDVAGTTGLQYQRRQGHTPGRECVQDARVTTWRMEIIRSRPGARAGRFNAR
ncbi:MAG: hypothetical protein Q9170_007050 [Blastenia crenularia]